MEGFVLPLHCYLLLVEEFGAFFRPGSVIADIEMTFNRTVGKSEVETLISEAIASDGRLGNITAVGVVVRSTPEGEITLLES